MSAPAEGFYVVYHEGMGRNKDDSAVPVLGFVLMDVREKDPKTGELVEWSKVSPLVYVGWIEPAGEFGNNYSVLSKDQLLKDYPWEAQQIGVMYRGGDE